MVIYVGRMHISPDSTFQRYPQMPAQGFPNSTYSNSVEDEVHTI